MKAQSMSQTKTSSATVLNGDFSGILQRKCESCGQHTIAGGVCGDCGKKKSFIQRKTGNQDFSSNSLSFSNVPVAQTGSTIITSNVSFISNFPTMQGVASSGTGRDELAPPPKDGKCSVGRSESKCVDDVGYMTTKIDNDCCTRPCTIEHEKHHVQDLDKCCTAYNRERKVDSANQSEIDKAWLRWMDTARKVTECRAYSDDLLCAQRLAIQKGCVAETEDNGSLRAVASSNENGSISDEVSGITAQNASLSAKVLSGVKEQSSCCDDIAHYVEMFAPEAKWWCSLAGGKNIPPCPFPFKPKQPSNNIGKKN